MEYIKKRKIIIIPFLLLIVIYMFIMAFINDSYFFIINNKVSVSICSYINDKIILKNENIDYEGTWNRLDEDARRWGQIKITDWENGESFRVRLDAGYELYCGTLEGKAEFINEYTAVLYDDFAIQTLKNYEGDHGVYFIFSEDAIIVKHDRSLSLCFGGGGIATAEGVYVK